VFFDTRHELLFVLPGWKDMLYSRYNHPAVVVLRGWIDGAATSE
jgi:hypothetical protein